MPLKVQPSMWTLSPLLKRHGRYRQLTLPISITNLLICFVTLVEHLCTRPAVCHTCFQITFTCRNLIKWSHVRGDFLHSERKYDGITTEERLCALTLTLSTLVKNKKKEVKEQDSRWWDNSEFQWCHCLLTSSGIESAFVIGWSLPFAAAVSGLLCFCYFFFPSRHSAVVVITHSAASRLTNRSISVR